MNAHCTLGVHRSRLGQATIEEMDGDIGESFRSTRTYGRLSQISAPQTATARKETDGSSDQVAAWGTVKPTFPSLYIVE